MKHFLTIFTFAALLVASCKPAPEFKLDENIGICGVPGKVEAAKRHGLAYVEAGVASFLMPEKSEEEFAANRAFAASCVPPIRTANGFYPKDVIFVGPDADIDRAVRYAETAIRRAHEIGIEVLVLGSGRSRGIPEGFEKEKAVEQFVAVLKGMAPCAEKHGVKIVIEPLQKKECNFVNTVREGAAIARMVGSPNVGVLADFFHMRREQEDAGALTESADKLWHCHIAEVEERTAPGVKGDDFTDYFKALKEIGYTGRISFECGWKDIDIQLPKAMEVMKTQIQSVK